MMITGPNDHKKKLFPIIAIDECIKFKRERNGAPVELYYLNVDQEMKKSTPAFEDSETAETHENLKSNFFKHALQIDCEAADLKVNFFDDALDLENFKQNHTSKILQSTSEIAVVYTEIEKYEWTLEKLINWVQAACGNNSLIIVQGFEFLNFKDDEGFGDLYKFIKSLAHYWGLNGELNGGSNSTEFPLGLFIDAPDDKLRSDILKFKNKEIVKNWMVEDIQGVFFFRREVSILDHSV